MEKKNKFVKGKASCLVKTLYIIAAVLMAICAYMIVVSILYISNYASSYGVAVSSMMVDAIQYVITGSISYFIYGVLVFSAGKIIRLLQSRNEERSGISECEIQESERVDTFEKTETPEDENPSEEDIPQSEDAIEETKVINEEK